MHNLFQFLWWFYFFRPHVGVDVCTWYIQISAGDHRGHEAQSYEDSSYKWPSATWYVCCDLNSSPLEEKQVLFTTKLFLQPGRQASCYFHCAFLCCARWSNESTLVLRVVSNGLRSDISVDPDGLKRTLHLELLKLKHKLGPGTPMYVL